MQVVVNGEPRSVPARCTVLDLLRSLGLGEVRVAVEVNQQVVPRARHETELLGEGDIVEIVHFVGGG